MTVKREVFKVIGSPRIIAKIILKSDTNSKSTLLLEIYKILYLQMLLVIYTTAQKQGFISEPCFCAVRPAWA